MNSYFSCFCFMKPTKIYILYLRFSILYMILLTACGQLGDVLCARGNRQKIYSLTNTIHMYQFYFEYWWHWTCWNSFLPSNVLSSTYFLGKTFFFSKIFLGDPPLNFFGGVSKIQVYGKMKWKIRFSHCKVAKKTLFCRCRTWVHCA